MHEHLIAPRPVRVASNPTLPYNNMRRTTPVSIRSPVPAVKLGAHPSDSFAVLRLDGSTDPEEDYIRRSPGSPRSHMALPQETLEEFLSILRPSVLPFYSIAKYPASPVRRSHKSRASLPTMRSSPSYVSSGKQDVNEITDAQFIAATSLEPNETTHRDLDVSPSAWRGNGLLSSPVSRNHTMNPFARRPSHEDIALTLSHCWQPTASPASNILLHIDRTPLSPTMVPLPPSTSPPPYVSPEEPQEIIS